MPALRRRQPSASGKAGATYAPLPADLLNLHLVRHHLVEHKLTRLRDVTCPYDEFRRLMREVGLLLGAEVTRDLGPEAMKDVTVYTQFAPEGTSGAPGRRIKRNNAVIVPILRSGAVFAESLNLIMNTALFGHIGFHREPDTSTPPQVYMVKLPALQHRTIFLTEPIIATGLTADAVLTMLEELGATEANDTSIVFLSLLVGRKAILHLARKYPKVQFFFAGIDDELTNDGFLKPGLGDVGERLFGTTES